MATIALGLVGTAIGTAIGGSVTLLGATITAAAIGGAVGSSLGSYVDSMIIASLAPGMRNEGPRLQEIAVMQSTEGATVGKLFGSMRIGGNLIWASRFKETKTTTSESVGGKGGGQTIESTSYTYSCSFAVAFGEGNDRVQLGRVWMDGKEIDLSTVKITFYLGNETQLPDSVIQSIEGPGNTPAFRGTTYIVFEDFQLQDYSNRIPQVTAEIVSPIETSLPGDISNIAKSFCLIPGSGEFAYGTDVYTQQNSSGSVLNTFFPGNSFVNQAGDNIALPTRSGDQAPALFMNMHNQAGEANLVHSIKQLELLQPNLDAILLVVGWFGNDLRADECELRPYVEYKERDGVVTPREWNVAGMNRSNADVLEVGRYGDGSPVYGGTPSDDVVIEAIRWLKERGHRVVFYPFVFMHIETTNSLPNPYSDNAAELGQPVFPWRGRITCSPAAGYTGTVDKTTSAATQINNFFTRTWGFNNMVEHYAQLCEDAGGVDAFLIGTEMVGLTQVRSDASAYPAISNLKSLAGAVKGIVGGSGTKVSYAADWSEYHSHRPDDGSGDIFYPLDELWADANIDFIGIDNYLPISDWRNGTSHLDYDADQGVVSPHNINYLKSNIEGGEYYDWYYASESDRDDQIRTPIVDSAYAKPWVFRQKDIRNWWGNLHYPRPGGIESPSATSWVAGSKPIWFTEFGCPSVDKGTNQPNVFYDPKSSESFFPHYSNGLQDEYISRVYAEAMLQYWEDESPLGMISTSNMFIWCWDARPFPDYPSRTDTWSDGDLYRYGHWMNGRIAYPALPRLIETLCEQVGLTDYDTSQLNGAQGIVKGYYIDNIMAVRDIIASLMTGFQFDAFESEGLIKFALKASTRIISLDLDNLVSTESDPSGLIISRAQNTELPKRVVVDFVDADNDYEVSSLDAKRHQTTNSEVSSVRLPQSLTPDYVRGLADSILHQAWVARESGTMRLPPSMFKLDPGDGIEFPLGDHTAVVRLQSIDTGELREASFLGFDPSLYSLPVYPQNVKSSRVSRLPGFPELILLDIPLYSGDEPSHWSPRLAAYASPWPGSIAVYQDEDPDPETFDWVLGRSLKLENVIGTLAYAVGTSKTSVWLPNQTVTVNLLGGTLPSSDNPIRVLKGDNACAMQNDQGHWELFQYETATLNGDGSYTLSNLIRGQLGTEWVMNEAPFSEGNSFVLIENQFSINPSTAPYIPLGASDRDSVINLRFGSAEKPVEDDNAYLEVAYNYEAMAKKPYSPVHLKARWNLGTSNDIDLSWVRRTRFDGDAWETAQVPLHEDTEQYELEILDGSTVVREVTGLALPVYNYTSDMQIEDFGSNQKTSIKIRVYQMSAAVGRGIPAEETITR